MTAVVEMKCNHCDAMVRGNVDEALAWDKTHRATCGGAK